MSAELLDTAAKAVDMLKFSGADEAWASVAQVREVEFNYRDGELEKVQDTTAQGMVVQVYANGRYSMHQTTDLHEARLEGFLKEAVAITGALEPDPSRQITPAELFADRPTRALDLLDGEIGALERDQRIAWCVSMDDVARDNERVISATSRVRTGSQVEAAVSSNGFSGTEEATHCILSSSVTLRDRGDRRASDGFAAVARHVSDIPEASVIGTAALERALVRLDADKGPTLKGTMVVDSRAAAQLIGRLMGSANARLVQQGRSFWAS